MRKRVVQRIALAAILFLTGSLVGTIALSLKQRLAGATRQKLAPRISTQVRERRVLSAKCKT